MTSTDWITIAGEADQAFRDGRVVTQEKRTLERWLIALSFALCRPTADRERLQAQRESIEHLLAARSAEPLRRYELLAQHSRDIVLFMRGDDGRLLEVNAAAVAAYGYSREELLALTIHHLRAPSTQNRVADQMEVATARGILFETAHRRKDGSLFPVEVSSQGAQIAGERTLISIVRDITERKQAEEALRLSDEKFAKAFASNPAALAFTRLADGRILEVNETWSQMFGYSRDEAIGQSSLALQLWPTVEDRARWMAEVQRKRSFRDWEQMLLKRSGESMVMLGSAEILSLAGDEIVLSTWLDISGRKRAELALRASEELWRGVFEHAAMGIAVLDWSGQFQTCNPAFCRLLGYTQDELRRIHFASLLHPDDAAENLRLAACMKTQGGPSFELESRYVHKDGRTIWVNKFLCVRTDDRGQRSVMVLVTDITQRRITEDEMRLASQRFETALAASPVMVFNQDTELRYTWVNNGPPDMKSGEILGKRDADILPCSADAANLDAIKRQVLASGIGQRREIVLRFGDMDRVYDLTVQPQRDAAGTIVGITCAAVEITARKRAEEELGAARRTAEAASKAKDHFLAVLSHELRTPLTPVLAAAELLEADQSLSAEHHDLVQMMRRNVELEARLIDDLLDLTRISRNKLELRPTIVDVHEKIGHVLRICQEEIAAKQLSIALDLSAGASHVEADSTRFQQIIWNVLKNAVKFTPAFGRITLSTTNPDGHCISISVTDTGAGIAPEVLPQIFEAFEQGGRGVTRQFGGLGLGLAISRALVEMHGGAIRAASDGPGRGATFTISLPLNAGPGGPTTRETVSPRAKVAGSILLVEDHADTLRALTRYLNRLGLTVVPASSVADALKLAAAQKFDVLVSDIGLPDGTGIELMQALKARSEIRGIALTGYGMDEDIARTKAAGFAIHLRKPANVRQLEEAVRQLLV